MHSGWRQNGCGDIITTGHIRPLAVSRRDSYCARPNSFYLLLQWEMGGLQGITGAALDLLEQGEPLEKIMLRGGWQTDSTAMKYLRNWVF